MAPLQEAVSPEASPPTIPIRNVWHMLLYAWNLPQFVGQRSIAFDDSPDLINLLARVLGFVIRAQLRRGLHQEFVEVEERLRFLRGRIDLLGSARRLELIHGSATCRYDELDQDVLANRILRTSLVHLSTRAGLVSSQRQALRALALRLRPVQVLPFVTGELFGRVRIGRNNASYRLLMEVCRLVWELRLPTENRGGDVFSGLLTDELRMSEVFEAFIRNFYVLRMRSFDVRAEWLEWPTQGNRQYLPQMKTDVSLTNHSRRIVIDAKYYRNTLVERREGRRTVRSGHLYQLFAYLRTQEHRGPPYLQAEGFLVYPTVGETVDERYEVQGHSIRVATLDLALPWREIEARLLQLIQPELISRSPAGGGHDDRQIQ